MRCGACGEPLVVVLDLGELALAGAFLRAPDAPEQLYRLRLGLCMRCELVQVADPVEPGALFGQAYTYRSGATATAREHFRRYAEALTRQFAPESVLEIGANDGTMLQHFRAERVVGVDPSAPDGGQVLRAAFTRDLARGMGTFDLVVANNVLAHAGDLDDFLRGVRAVVGSGVFVFEVHYLGDLIAKLQYDAIYHEHRYYFSLRSLDRVLARHGLRAFDAERLPMHGGTLRVYADKMLRPEALSVQAIRNHESGWRLRPEVFERFGNRMWQNADTLASLAPMVGYGAAGRANTLLQLARPPIVYIVDDAPTRQGLYTPGTHIPVRAELEDDGLQVMVLAWTYADEILPKIGRRQAWLPLPWVRRAEDVVPA